MADMLKVCSICNEEKQTLEFYKSKNTPDGFFTYCKKCQIAKSTVNRKRRDYEVAYAKNFAQDLNVTHDKVVDLVKHVIRDLSDELTELVKYIDLKPAMKRALISEIESTCLIKSGSYVEQLKNVTFIDNEPDESERVADQRYGV